MTVLPLFAYTDYIMLSETPEFVMVVRNKNGVESTVSPELYRVELNTRTTFTEADWSGSAGEDWVLYEDATDEQRLAARSLRVVFYDGGHSKNSELVTQRNCELVFSFRARIDESDPGATPGAIAWNGFGYHYRLFGRTTELEAAPLEVGLRIPELPRLSKSLVNARERAYTTRAGEAPVFNYVMYEGSAISGVPGTMTEAQIIQAIEAQKRNYVRATVTVPEGSSASQVSFEFDDKLGRMVEDGAYNDDVWVMNDGAWYNLVELPCDGYISSRYNGEKVTSYRFKYSAEDPALNIESENMRQDWSMKLEKRDQNENPVSGAVFALYTPVENEALAGLDTLDLAALNARFGTALTEMPEKTLQAEDDEDTVYRLMALLISNDVGEAQLDALSGAQYLCQEVQAPAHYVKSEECVTVKRKGTTSDVVTFAVTDTHVLEDNRVYIDTRKALTGGRPLKEGEFEFIIEGYDIVRQQAYEDGAADMPPMPEDTRVVNAADGGIRFGPISMDVQDIGKDYYYRITEVVPLEGERVKDVQYTDRPYIVKATVIDNRDGTLGVSLEASWVNDKNQRTTVAPEDFAFVNRYENETQAAIPVVKNLIDRDWKEGDAFTFELISQDPELDGRPATVLTVTPENRDDAQLIRTFDQEYTGRTIPYILRERVPDAAVAFDAAGKKLRVQKSAESTTKVDLTYQRYRLMSPEAQAAVVAQAGGAPSWRLDGLLYDTTEHPVEIEVFYDESIQALNTKVNGSLTSEAVKFSNSFTTDNTTARVTVQKEIQNRPWLRAAEETYRFKITPADPGAPMPSADGVRVDEIEIKRGRDVSAPIQSAGFEIEYQWSDLRSPDGTHAESKAFDYVLTEIVPDDAERLEEDGQLVGYMYKRVKYDLTSRTVRVTLKDNGDGTIGTEVTYLSADGEGAEGTDPVPFVNVYEQEDRLTEFPVSITKKVNDSRPVKGSYSFTLLDESKNPLEHLTWQADKADEWGAQLLTVVRDIPCEDVDVDHPKTVTYLLREDIPDNAMGYDAAGNPLNVRFADADGTLKWDETVKWKHQGVTYDSAITEVHVKIELSKVDYLLHATVKYNQNERTATARNGYESRGEIGFNVNKALTGRAFGEDETFKFTLTPLDGAPALLDETPEAGSETPARFGPLVFDLNQFPDAADGRYGEWSFQYRLGEVIPRRPPSRRRAASRSPTAASHRSRPWPTTGSGRIAA